MTYDWLVPNVEKNRLFEHEYIIDLVELVAGHHFRDSELHCIVLLYLEERVEIRTTTDEKVND